MMFAKRKIVFPPYVIFSLMFALMASIIILTVRGCSIAHEVSPFEAESEGADNISVSVYMHRENRTQTMPLEEYLMGVVAAEMPASFETEALKAQAVAARTFTVRHMKKFGGAPCSDKGEICTDSTCCQAYRSDSELRDNWGANYERNKARIREAVLETASRIVTYAGKPIEALYHSSSGGATEDAVNVFSQARPYLVGVESPGEEASSHYETTVELSAKEFANKVNSKWRTAKLTAKKLKKQVKVASRYESGRVRELKLGSISVSGRDMRKLLGLDSTNFTISVSGESVKIATRGYGHGVGMSQYGANAMAKSGSDYKAIISHYYCDTEITPLTQM